MLKISESLIQFEDLALASTEDMVVESADRILREYRSASREKTLPTNVDEPPRLDVFPRAPE